MPAGHRSAKRKQEKELKKKENKKQARQGAAVTSVQARAPHMIPQSRVGEPKQRSCCDQRAGASSSAAHDDEGRPGGAEREKAEREKCPIPPRVGLFSSSS
jgi:hypothetical protein